MKGRSVLITGGGTGIGAACAARFGADGAQVAVLGRRKAPLEEVAQTTGAMPLVADAACADEVRKAIGEIIQSFGGLDVLIANAGGHGVGAATQVSDAAWAESARANLDTAFVTVRECLPWIIANRGTIVIVGSIAGLAAGPGVCAYTTFKHALIGLTRSLARDYGPRGVRVNAVCPGWVRTAMSDDEMAPLMQRHGFTLDQAYAHFTANVPLRRAAEPEEIAAVCRFLASDEASIMTGAIVVADAGATTVDVPTLAFEG